MESVTNASANLCAVCASPFRYEAEQAFLEGRPVDSWGFTAALLRRHMSHVADRQTLDLVTGLTSATSIAARMQQMATAAESIFALAIEQADGKLALAALREARQTLQAMADLGSQVADLSGAHGDSSERPDLDDQIGAYVAGDRPGAGSHSSPASGRDGAAPDGAEPAALSPPRAPLAIDPPSPSA